MTARLIYGVDVMEGLKQIEDESVHCVVTSPPYWGLRDYGTGTWTGGELECKHKRPDGEGNPRPDLPNPPAGWAERDATVRTAFVECPCGARRQDRQIGLESTPEEYVEKIVTVFREIKRVLRKDSTLWLNLGDTYSGSGNGSWNVENPEHFGKQFYKNMRPNEYLAPPRKDFKALPPKNLIGIPWRVAFALQADGWWLRQDIIWSKANPMPESVTDRCTKAHEYIFLLTKSAKYFYNAEVVKEESTDSYNGQRGQIKKRTKIQSAMTDRVFNTHGRIRPHGITHNRELAYKSKENLLHGINTVASVKSENDLASAPPFRNKRSVWEIPTQPYPKAHFATFPEEIPRLCISAGCPQEGLVLDPFCGSGTTGEVAVKLGRSFIGIDLNKEYEQLAKERIGLFCL